MWPGAKQPEPPAAAAESSWSISAVAASLSDVAAAAAATLWNGPLFYLVALIAFALLCDLVRRVFFMRRVVFRDVHVLVTGGSQGIGKALATQLLKRGARVTLLARTESKAADRRPNRGPCHSRPAAEPRTVVAGETQVGSGGAWLALACHGSTVRGSLSGLAWL